jgi:cytochrome c
MRRTLATALALGFAALAAGCGKPASQGGTSEAPAAKAPSEAEMRAALATLPAPYNGADLANGEAKFGLCGACHTIAPGGPNLTGPHLHGVVGRKAGSLPDYNYSDAVKAAGFTWDPARLDKWLTDPRADLPGNKMSFFGLKNPKDRKDLIAFLMVNSQ